MNGRAHGEGRMQTPGSPDYLLLLVAGVLLLLLSACTRPLVPTIEKHSPQPCHIIYDAGSAATRLYVYQKTASGWFMHDGPEVAALADPVRKTRGKAGSDANIVVDEIVAALEGIRTDGPLNKKGKPEWIAFDWREQCSVEAVSVLATAGMRMAKQKDAVATKAIWSLLNQRLASAVGMQVTTRTLSGYEEGLYAWLATREKRAGSNFGMAEMGGVSLQVTFPCAHCKASRQVMVKGQSEAIYSYSFLGWGQDEAWKKSGSLAACARAAGLDNPDWKPADCARGMAVFSDTFSMLKKNISQSTDMDWLLSGSFRYRRDTDIDEFCRKGSDSGFQQTTSCFRAVYLQYVIDGLGLPANSKPSNVDWTLGAVICADTQCLDTH